MFSDTHAFLERLRAMMAIPFVTAEPLFKIRIEEPPTTRSLATQRPETAPF